MVANTPEDIHNISPTTITLPMAKDKWIENMYLCSQLITNSRIFDFHTNFWWNIYVTKFNNWFNIVIHKVASFLFISIGFKLYNSKFSIDNQCEIMIKCCIKRKIIELLSDGDWRAGRCRGILTVTIMFLMTLSLI